MTQDSLRLRKKNLRQAAVSNIASFSPGKRKEETAVLQQRLFEMPEISRSPRVFSFLGFGDELNLDGFHERILTEGKALYVPRLLSAPSKGALMEFCRVSGELKNLPCNSYGIREPLEDADVFNPDTARNIPVIVPGLAFDSKCRRLGRGGGYYDHFLRRYRTRLLAVGVCFSVQVVDEVPFGVDDEFVDTLVTHSNTYARKENDN